MRNIEPIPTMNSSAKHDWALQQLQQAQVRSTPVREKVLAFLAHRTVPATLHDISASAELARQFDDATVYRTLVLLVELDIARQLQLRDRATCFVLNVPGECLSFLVCRCCGSITRIPHRDELHAIERQMTAIHGYTSLTHELELYGVCPNCREHTTVCCKPTKLVSGMRLRRSNN